MKKPLVSIGIPTYNRLELLKRCLNSVLGQTYKNLEIIVSDNASDDETERYVKKLVKSDARLKYYRQEKNMGPGFQGTFLKTHVTGDYYYLVCDDDWLDLNFIEDCYNYFKNNPNVMFCRGAVVLHDVAGNVMQSYGEDFFLQDSYVDRIKEYILHGIDHKVDGSFFCETKPLLLETVTGSKNRGFEDQVMVLKKLMIGKCACFATSRYHKTHNGCTMNLERLKETFKEFSQGCDTMEDFWIVLARGYVQAINEDDFFIDRLDAEKRKLLGLEIVEAFYQKLICEDKLYDFKAYWKSMSFPFVRRSFYKVFLKNILYRMQFAKLKKLAARKGIA